MFLRNILIQQSLVGIYLKLPIRSTWEYNGFFIIISSQSLKIAYEFDKNPFIKQNSQNNCWSLTSRCTGVHRPIFIMFFMHKTKNCTWIRCSCCIFGRKICLDFEQKTLLRRSSGVAFLAFASQQAVKLSW